MKNILSSDVFYFICFFLFFSSYKDYYSKAADISEVLLNYYDIPVAALNRKIFSLKKYKAENSIEYIPFRQLQFRFTNRLLVIFCFMMNQILLFVFNKHSLGLILYLLLYFIILNYIPYTLVKRDVLRISKFTFTVQNGKPSFVQAAGKFPRWLKPTTLLDAFYWLGESTIWKHEGQYFLAYILPDNRKIIIRLKSSGPQLFADDQGIIKRIHNPAQYVFIEDIVNI